MKLLLDTHIWIWMVLDPSRLSRRVARELDKAENQLWLSPISVWELLMLTEKGRVHLKEDAVSWTLKALKRLQLNEAR